MTQTTFNGHSMVGALQRLLVCSPVTAGWHERERAARWRDLGFLHPLDFDRAQAQHRTLCRQLQDAGCEVIELPPADDLTLDAVYAHDASFCTDLGLIVMHPGKETRVAEGRNHEAFCARLAVPAMAKIVAPGTTEAGDMVWLDAKTLLIGRGYRTNGEGISQMRRILAARGIEVIAAPLPHGTGPSACLHLMSLMSMLDDRTVLVDLPMLAVETVELLEQRGLTLMEIDSSERETLACNVLALGKNRLLAIEENRRTNERLRKAGFDVRTFPGDELCINGGGGPTCLTRPLLRL